MSFDGSWHMYRSMTRDRSVSSRKVNRVLVRRILGYARKYRGLIVVFLITLVLVSLLSVAQPLMIPRLVDDGINEGNRQVVTVMALVIAALAIMDAALGLVSRWFSSLLVKLFGRPEDEAASFSSKAIRVRDIGVRMAMANRWFFTALTLVAALATAIVYGLGGNLVISDVLTIGTLLALVGLLAQLYGPLTALSNVRVDVMTALVSFERVFEVLDLQPLVKEAPDAVPLPDGPLSVEFGSVASTSARRRCPRCVRASASSPRTRICSTTRFARTSCTRGRKRRRPSSSRPARPRRSAR